jgi:alkylation response protein AidB-like acyl-CoA dehydrogenase
MKFELTAEQQAFVSSLDSLLAAADTVGAARAWAEGDHGAGLKLWSQLADQGVHALLVPEESGGMGASWMEMVLAAEVIGNHALPGPWAESIAWLPTALTDPAALESVAGGAVGTVQIAGTARSAALVPYALDADVADLAIAVRADGVRRGAATTQVTSIDPTRRLFDLREGATISTAKFDVAFDAAALATGALLLGAGERVLADAVRYVKQRTQFGRPIGSYQAIKHHLADVRIALDFARPLLWGAALSGAARDVSAAKVACGDAAYLASRTALQVHGAIGYTHEYDLSIWLLRIRALVGAWGTTDWHRGRLLESLTAAPGEAAAGCPFGHGSTS